MQNNVTVKTIGFKKFKGEEMFIVEIVLVGVMGLLFLWLGLSLMFEKPDSTGFTSGLVVISFNIVLTVVIVAGAVG